MQAFYKKALLALILMVIVDALLASLLIHRSYLSVRLVAQHGGAGWRQTVDTDQLVGGKSTVRIDPQALDKLRFDLRLVDGPPYPFAFAALQLDDGKGGPALADWSKYSTVTFHARCAPTNVMIFTISTFDAEVSKPGQYQTYRSPGTYFSCNEKGVQVSLDLTRLIMPGWWFDHMRVDPTKQGYDLEKVAKVAFGTSHQSPRNVDTHVEISELSLRGRDERYLVALAVLLVAGWAAFGFWFFRAHTRALTASLNSRMKKDLPLVAYRQLTLEPYKDKAKAAVLRYIAENYTNTELDLESVVSGTGTNRHKVSEVLKAELGMSFTSYVNKLRLTEAARLLAEKSGAGIAEIAYSVGYSNVSYFNRLFKEEYGCTPKSFRALATPEDQADEGAPPDAPRPPADTGG